MLIWKGLERMYVFGYEGLQGNNNCMYLFKEEQYDAAGQVLMWVPYTGVEMSVLLHQAEKRKESACIRLHVDVCLCLQIKAK